MKKFLSILLTMMMVLTMTGIVFADVQFDENSITLSNGLGGATSKVSDILGAIQWIGYVIALGMLIYVGIKYIMSSAQEKADLKSNMVRFVIGAIIIAGASTIFGWVKGIV